MMPDADQLSEFFNELCDAAAQETLPRFRSNPTITDKKPGHYDPVTEGDRQAELAIRARIEERFPDHGIIGEEFGTLHEKAAIQWIIDPIDGTRAFISGLPVWGTLIGLYRDGKPFAGVMDQPFTGERFMATRDQAEKLSTSLSIRGAAATELATRNTDTLAQATLMTTSKHLFDGPDFDHYENLESKVKLARYGCDCYAYAMVAAGHIDLVVENGLSIYDIAALIPVIEGAGGIVTNWQGGDASQGGSILAAANVRLHEQALAALN